MKKIKRLIYKPRTPLPGTQDWGTYLLNLNIRRIPYIAVLIAVFQLANLFVNHRYFYRVLPVWGVAILLVVSVVYGLTAFLIPMRIIANPKAARSFMSSFWVLLYVGCVPFFIQDIIQDAQLINVTLFFSMFLVVPLFPKTERIILPSLFFTATLVIAVLYDASVPHLVFIILLGLSVGLLTYTVQGHLLTVLKRLRYEAYCDVLTDVLNRRGGLNNVKKRLDEAKAQADTLAFFMIDLDFFKSINDAYGHRKGDEVLVTVANALKLMFDAPGDVICRIGGEEFLVCISVKDRAEAEEYAGNLVQMIEARQIPTPCADVSQYLTVSVGVRVYTPEHADDSKDEMLLMDDADIALYRAKEGGRNRYEVY